MSRRIGGDMTEKTKADLLRLKRIEEMKRIWIHTPEKNRSLWELAETEHIVRRVEYFANIGRPTGSCDDGGWIVERKRTDVGLIFGNGLEVRGIEEKFFNFFKGIEIIEKMERL